MPNSKPVEIVFIKSVKKDSSMPSGIAYSITSVVDINSDYDGDIQFNDTQVFLFKYSDDSFSRVCNVADFDIFPKVKTLGYEYYRDNKFTANYMDLSVAVASMPVLRDRVSAVVQARIDLVSSFTGSTNAVDLPYTDVSESSKESYKVAYTDARDTRASTEADIQLSNTEYAIAKEKELAMAKVVTWLSDLVPKLKKASDGIDDFSTLNSWSGSTITNPVINYRLELEELDQASTLTVSDVVTRLGQLETQINTIAGTIRLGLRWGVSVNNSQVTLKTYLDSLYYSYASIASVADSQLAQLAATSSTKDSQLKVKQVALEDASAAEQKAISDITRYCPDLDLNSL